MSSKKNLSQEQTQDLLKTLKVRFEKNSVLNNQTIKIKTINRKFSKKNQRIQPFIRGTIQQLNH